MQLKEVLLIDDSEADLLYTQIVVESAAIARGVRAFDTAVEALAFLQRPEGHEADVILLDINMPEMDGFAFLDRYEQLHRSQQAHAVVVMLTSSPDPKDRARALAYACVKDYVVKPIELDAARALVAVVRAAAGD